MDRWKWIMSAIIIGGTLLMFSGCSGGIGISLGAGGSIHNPNHKDLSRIVRNTPVVNTSTEKSWALPMVRKEK